MSAIRPKRTLNNHSSVPALGRSKSHSPDNRRTRRPPVVNLPLRAESRRSRLLRMDSFHRRKANRNAKLPNGELGTPQGAIILQNLIFTATCTSAAVTVPSDQLSSTVLISASEVSVRCTGHLSAISISRARWLSSRFPESVIARSIRSSIPSLVLQFAQSAA